MGFFPLISHCQHDPSLSVLLKERSQLVSEVSLRPFLAGARADAETFQDFIRKDKDKELVYSLMDIPGVQESKQFYIERKKKLFRECCKDGGWYIIIL